MEVKVDPGKVFKIFLFINFFLLFGNLVGIIFFYNLDHRYVFGLIRMFSFREELSFPTFYSSIGLLFSSILLFLISFLERESGERFKNWLVLGFIFLFLSIDESVCIHEELTEIIREHIFATVGFFHYVWVIPYGLFLILFVLFYLPFLRRLPGRVMVLFIISGLVYIIGAIGFEMVSGAYYEKYGDDNAVFSYICTCEEFFEMFGITIFIYTLLYYIRDFLKISSIRLDFKSG